MDGNGIDTKNVVRGKQVKQTVIVRRRRRTCTKRRGLVGNGVVIDGFDNRKADLGLDKRKSDLGLETRLETRLGAERSVSRIRRDGKRRRNTRDRSNSRGSGR